MSFPRYPKYKPSCVEWLGDVPEGWEVKRLKHIAEEKPFAIVDGPFGTQLKADDYRPEGVPLVRISNLSYDGQFSAEDLVFIDQSKAEEVCRSAIRRGDIVVGKTGATIGKSALFDYSDQGIIASSCIKITPDIHEMSSRFVLFTIVSGSFQKTLVNESGGSTRDTINITPFGNLKIAAPPLSEQTAIAEFLDRETGKIDELVAEQRRLMELLKEKRQAVISHAVTKGLNPHAPMKPSGIEWLGDVPEHWGVWKLTHAFEKIGSGTTPKTENREYYDDGTHPWVNTGDLNDGYLTDCEKKITDLALSDHTTLRIYPAGSVVIAMYGATIGKLAILQFPASVNQACCVFSGRLTIEYKFLLFWLLAYRPQIISLASGGGQPNVNQDILRGLRVACPSLPEQTTIIEFLDAELAKFDTLTAEAQRAIGLLQERRTALISAAVTGQIDVRDVRTREFD